MPLLVIFYRNNYKAVSFLAGTELSPPAVGLLQTALSLLLWAPGYSRAGDSQSISQHGQGSLHVMQVNSIFLWGVLFLFLNSPGF